MAPQTAHHGLLTILQLKDNLPAELKSLALQLYETDIGNLYAVTVGAETSNSEAIVMAAAIREAVLIPDAYAQGNRGWTRIEI